MRTRLLLVLCFVLSPALSRACSIPVFRYALERWELSAYELTVFYDTQLPGDLDKLLKALEAGTPKANVKIERVDVTGKMDPYQVKLWDRQGAKKTLPWLSARLPESEANLPDAFGGPLTADNLRRLLDSPVRQQLVERLSKGTTAVFLLLPGSDAAANQKAAELLDKELARIAKLVELPELKPEDKLKTGVPLKIEFVTLKLNREDPAEQLFIQALLNSDLELLKVRGPIVFPVFGRGRMLCSVYGPELNPNILKDVVRFLCQECSCQLKELNPGSDLLIAADWLALLEKAGPPNAVVEVKPPPSAVEIKVAKNGDAKPEVAVAAPMQPAGIEPNDEKIAAEKSPTNENSVDPRPSNATESVIVPPSVAPAVSADDCGCPISNLAKKPWLLAAVGGAGLLVLITGMWVFLKRK